MKIYFSPSFIQEPINLATVKEESQECILFRMKAGEYLTLENPNILLLVPNDNSTFARQIKEVVDKDETYHNAFATSAENLKIKLNFWSAKNLTFHGLLIKDTSQVEKVAVNNSKPTLEPGQITFKARKYTEKDKNEWGSYIGELEVEPFSLGMEGLSPITKLNFRFITKENPSPGPKDPHIKELTESELYKSKLLAESAGKTFSMGFKKLYLGYFGDLTDLTFSGSDDYVFNSLSEIKNQDNPETPPTTPPKNDDSNNSSPNHEPHKGFGTSKVVLIVVVIIVGLSFLAFIFYHSKKRKA
jgi:hypothetical protein